jgi:hypothetical protein
MTQGLRHIFCKYVTSMDLAHHAIFDVATALMLKIKVFWIVMLDSMVFIQDLLNP